MIVAGLSLWCMSRAFSCELPRAPQDHWRHAILERWERLSSTHQALLQMLTATETLETAEIAKAVGIVFQVLLHAVRKSVAMDRSFWTKHVSKNVNHVSGWFPWMLRLGVLRTASSSSSRSATEVFKVDGVPRWQAGKATEINISKLADMARLASAIRSTKPPKTLTQYKAAVECLSKFGSLLSDVGALGVGSTYGFLWTVRAMLIAEMRAAGIEKLRIDSANMTTSTLSKVFPDMSGWASRVAQSGCRSPKISALMKTLRWTGPVELLTCLLCVTCTEVVFAMDATILQSSRNRIAAARRAFRRHRRFEAHPVHILTGLYQDKGDSD